MKEAPVADRWKPKGPAAGSEGTRNVEASRIGRLACILTVVASACGGGGGGGGSSGIGLDDLNLDGQIVVMCFGDSITRGVGDGSDARATPRGPGGYPVRLQALLTPLQNELPLTVINVGIPGEETPDGLRRLPSELFANKPDYTILLEGANDIEGGGLQRAVNNMQSMITSVIGGGSMPLVGTLTPTCCTHRTTVPSEAVRDFNAQIRFLAAGNMVPLVDFYVAFTGGDATLPGGTDLPFDENSGLIHVPEGLHPTFAGYDLMAGVAAAVFSGAEPPKFMPTPATPPPT